MKPVLRFLWISCSVLLVFLTISAGFSCKEKPKSQKDTNGKAEYLDSGFSDKYDPLDPENIDKLVRVYRLKPGTRFEGLYGINSAFQQKSTYHIVLLLDYKQVPVAFNDNRNIVHTAKLGPYKKKLIKFKTPPIKEEFHDFITLAFKNLDNRNASGDFSDEGITVAAVRSNIIAGKYSSREFSNSKFSGTEYRTKIFDGLLINQEKEDLTILDKSRVKRAKDKKHFVHLANSSEYWKSYALILFIDAKQIDIQNHKVIFTKIAPKTRLVIPFNLRIDESFNKGTHGLEAVAITSPGILLADNNTQKTPTYDEAILNSNRVALFVR